MGMLRISSMTRVGLLLALLAASVGSAYGQVPASGPSKAEVDYCFSHAMDESRCVLIPSDPNHPQSFWVPLPKSALKAFVASQPLTLEQKQLLEGTYPVAPPPTLPKLTGNVPAPPNSPLPSVSFGEPRLSQQPDQNQAQEREVQGTPNHQTEERERTANQSNYAAGYAMGHAVGELAARWIEGRRIASYCKRTPNGFWRMADGSTMSCQSWNSGKPIRAWPQGSSAVTTVTESDVQPRLPMQNYPPAPKCHDFASCFAASFSSAQQKREADRQREKALENLAAQDRAEERAFVARLDAQAQEAYALMEQLRQDVAQLQYTVDHDPVKEAIDANRVQVDEKDRPAIMTAIESNRKRLLNTINEAKSSWYNMRNIYCGRVAYGKYTNLDGTTVRCDLE